MGLWDEIKDAFKTKSERDEERAEDLKNALEQLIERKCVKQYVKTIGKNEVKLLKVDYELCKKYGYFD